MRQSQHLQKSQNNKEFLNFVKVAPKNILWKLKVSNCFFWREQEIRETTAVKIIIQSVENLPWTASEGKLKVKNEKKSTFCDSNGSS